MHDDSYIRKTAIRHKVPYITTTAAAIATAEGISAHRQGHADLRSLQQYHAGIGGLITPRRGLPAPSPTKPAAISPAVPGSRSPDPDAG